MTEQNVDETMVSAGVDSQEEYSDVDKLAEALVETGVLKFQPDECRLLIRIWRLLAKGHPVNLSQVGCIASELGMSTEAAANFVNRISEIDGLANIRGILGLSLNETPHSFSVNEQPLFAWCAADTLFLPSMLNLSAIVESRSPATGATIRLKVTPEGVEQCSPTNAVVTIPVSAISRRDVEADSVEKIWSLFCHQIFFFSSFEEAESWIREKNLDLKCFSVEEAYQLVDIIFEAIRKYA